MHSDICPSGAFLCVQGGSISAPGGDETPSAAFLFLVLCYFWMCDKISVLRYLIRLMRLMHDAWRVFGWRDAEGAVG